MDDKTPTSASGSTASSVPPERDMFTKSKRSKQLGRWRVVLRHDGVGGVVPNHAPHTRTMTISSGRDGWRLHLMLQTLRTWDGLLDADISVALHPSRERRERLQAKATSSSARSARREEGTDA